MANKKMKWFSIATLACAASLCVGFGAANVTADAEAVALDGFKIEYTSVRLDDPTKEGVDSGLRFKVDVPEGVKVENAFTVVSFTSSVKTEENPNGDPKAYSTTIPATVYRADGGWNTVLLDIPASDYKTEVTAQAFATINGVEYKTAEKTSSINATATAAFNAGLAKLDEVGQYMDWETATESVTFADLGYANAADFSSYSVGDIAISAALGSNTNNNPPKYYDTGKGLRLYDGNTITITVGNGCIIDKVVFTASGDKYLINGTPSAGQLSTNGLTTTISGINGTSVTLTKGSGTSRTPKVEVTYKSLALGWEDRKAAVEEELEGLFAETYAKDAVVELPASIKGVALTWDSDNAAIAIANGKATITRPVDAPATVTVTVNGEHADGTLEKTYEITVAQISDQEKVDAEAAAIVFDKAYVKTLEDTVTLPNKTTKYNDVTIAWTIVSGNDANHLFLNGNVLTVNSLPTDANVTVKVQATATLNDASAETEEYEIEVVKSGGSVTVKEYSVTWTPSSAGYTDKQTLNGTKVQADSNISFTIAKDSSGTNPVYYASGTHVRFYYKNTLTFTATGNYKIKSIVITYSSGNKLNDAAKVSAGTISIDSTSATITAGGVASLVLTNGGTNGHARITSIKIVYEG